MLNDQSTLIVKRLIVIGTVASVAHFADNALEIGHYPEPNWIKPGIVLFAWIPVAVVAATALLRKNGDRIFATLAAIFGVLLLTALAHYLYRSPFQLAGLANFTIVFEALSGLALLILLSWSLTRNNSKQAS